MNSAYINPDALGTEPELKTPSSWSTVATPGTPDSVRYDPDDVVADGNPTPTPTRKAWVSGDIEGRNSDSDLEENSLLSRPGLTQTVSSSTEDSHTTGSSGVVSTASTTPASSTESEAEPFEVTVITPPVAPQPAAGELPPGFVPSPQPTVRSPPPPTVITPTQRATYVALPPPPPVLVPPQSEPIMTPLLVTKAQRHCKFAISALDYEDAETARRELRAALAMLGG